MALFFSDYSDLYLIDANLLDLISFLHGVDTES